MARSFRRSKSVKNIEKITNPGYKKVYRLYEKDTGQAIADLITLADEKIPEEPFEIFGFRARF